MDPHSNLRRADASEYLWKQHGIKHCPEYLAKLAVTGGGPPFRKVRRTPIYTPAGLDSYAAEITSPVVRSTSELRAATEAA
jgi:hypothetical protein